MSTPFTKAMALIDAAHAQDPRRIPVPKSQSNPSEPTTASEAKSADDHKSDDTNHGHEGKCVPSL